jgi:putative hydrolase of the HAD superfamily
MFDFGNVVAFFDYRLMFDRLAGRLGTTGAELERRLKERGGAELGRAFELGQLSAEDYARRLCTLAELEMPFSEFEIQWPDIFTLNEPLARLIPPLKRAGYTLLLGSNTNPLHARFFRDAFRDVMQHFDHFVFSYDIGAMKPSADFFRACLKAVGAPAGACVFIDDAEANVAGAVAAGLRGLVYRDPETLLDDLRRLGVEVPATQR